MPTIPQGELPLPKSWDEFEDICWDLYTRLWEDPHADRYGRGGKPQDGVDIFGRPKHLDGGCAGVQCKRYGEGKLSRPKIRDEIRKADKFTPTLAEYIIATTDPRAVDLQSFVLELSQEREKAGRFPVHIAFWDTLCGLLTNPDYEDILLKHYGEWVALAMRASPPTHSARFNLPADLPDFTGRQAQIDRVRDRLNQQGTVTITGIHGMGGIGKTALAVHVAHQLIAEGRFPDAQLYIDLQGAGTSPVDPVDALDSLLNAILDPDPNRPRDLHTLSAIWRRAIDTKDALLILDNAADAAQVRPLLPGCSTCAVLVTSRLRFTLSGARRLNLRPMQPAEARDLLQELAPHLDDDGADKIASLCGQLPQALRIAGNYLGLNDDVTSDQYAGMLADERTRLAQLRDPDDPDLDVAATISLSVAQLDKESRRAWTLLSLFPAPFDLPAAAALWDEPDEAQVLTRMQALRNRSLVTYDPESTRYHQHDLVRLASASERKAPLPYGEWGWGEGEVTAARYRMARHYAEVARETGRLYAQGGDKVLQGLALFDLEWPHIRAGQAWAAVHAEDDDEAARLCSSYPNAAALLPLRLKPRDWIAWPESALGAARRLGDKQAEGRHLGHLGNVYAFKREWDRAIECYEQALEMSEQVENSRGMARTTNGLGWCYTHKGEWDRAIEFYEQSLELAERFEDIKGMAQTITNLGNVYTSKGDWDRAVELHEQSLATQLRVGDIHGMAQTYNNLGNVYKQKEEWDQAIEFYEQSLEIAERLGYTQWRATATTNLGNVYYHKGEWDRAIELYEQAPEMFRQIGARQGEGRSLYNLGLAHRRLGSTARAREYLTQALTIFEALGDSSAEEVRHLLSELED